MYLLKSARQKNNDNNVKTTMLAELNVSCKKNLKVLQLQPPLHPTTMLWQMPPTTPQATPYAMPPVDHPRVRSYHNTSKNNNDDVYVPKTS
jgi:hypothetical protein